MNKFQYRSVIENIEKIAITKAKEIAGNDTRKLLMLANNFYQQLIEWQLYNIINCKELQNEN